MTPYLRVSWPSTVSTPPRWSGTLQKRAASGAGRFGIVNQVIGQYHRYRLACGGMFRQ
jgi:hypothetical protein